MKKNGEIKTVIAYICAMKTIIKYIMPTLAVAVMLLLETFPFVLRAQEVGLNVGQEVDQHVSLNVGQEVDQHVSLNVGHEVAQEVGQNVGQNLDKNVGQEVDKADIQDGKIPHELIVEKDNPILLMFTASWCAPCHFMRNVIFKNAEVAALLKKYNIVMLDIDTSMGATLQRVYCSQFSVPYYILLDKDQNPIIAQVGANERASDFAAFLRRGLPFEKDVALVDTVSQEDMDVLTGEDYKAAYKLSGDKVAATWHFIVEVGANVSNIGGSDYNKYKLGYSAFAGAQLRAYKTTFETGVMFNSIGGIYGVASAGTSSEGSVVSGKAGSVVSGKAGSVVSGKAWAVASGDVESVVSGKAESVASGERITLNYVGVPVDVAFKIYRGLYLGVGLSGAYLLTDLSSTTLDYKKFDVAMRVRVSYCFSPQVPLRISLGFNKGLVNLRRGDIINSSTNNTFALSLAYTF